MTNPTPDELQKAISELTLELNRNIICGSHILLSDNKHLEHVLSAAKLYKQSQTNLTTANEIIQARDRHVVELQAKVRTLERQISEMQQTLQHLSS